MLDLIVFVLMSRQMSILTRDLFVLLIFLVQIAPHAFGFEAAQRNGPNIVVILADDLGYSDLSCYGGWISTPNIDSLADSGIRMGDFHSNGAVCSPTRGAWLTGRYPQKTGVDSVVYADSNRAQHINGLQPEEFTIAEFFKANHYQTAIFGKWHLGYYKKYNPTGQGFDKFKGYVSGNIDFFSHIDQSGQFDWWHDKTFVEEKGYVTHLISGFSVDFIRAQSKKKNSQTPFFLYVAHEAPHYPYQGPNDSAERTEGGKFANSGSRKDKKEAYREMVESMDRGVGDILNALKDTNQLENTLIIFFSDNGANNLGSNKPWKGTKGSLWEGGHRVPAIFSWPGTLGHQSKCSQLMSGIDLFPTIAGFAGLKIPDQRLRMIDGLDLSNVLRKTAPVTNDRFIYWQHGNQKALRHGNMKWIDLGGKNKQAVYDVGPDIDKPEQNILLKDQALLTKKYARKWHEWRKKADFVRTKQPSENEETRKPRVLVLGDSISIGFMSSLKAMRDDEWEIHHNPGNARYTQYGLSKLDNWLGEDRWDVIHFNWGLHDLCYRHPESEIQGKRDKRKGVLTTNLDDYEVQLEQIVKKLRRSRARLIWASTTPVPENEPGRYAGSEILYNERAKKIMDKYSISINDLHAATNHRFHELTRAPGDVHFTPKGSELLAEFVVKAIEQKLLEK